MSVFERFRHAGMAARGSRIFLAIVAIAAMERVWLAFAGGQYFFWDENRFEQFYRFYLAGLAHDTAALREMFTRPDYPFYSCLGVVVIAAQHALSRLCTPYGDWTVPQHPFLTTGIASSLLGLASVASIVLAHRLVLAYGGDRTEAAWAAALLAASNSHLYYSRHLLPYDAALACALGALLAGRLARGPCGWTWSGALLGIGYSIYNGYWYLVPLIWVVLGFDLELRRLVRTRLVFVAAGSLFAVGLPYGAGWLINGSAYIKQVIRFGMDNKLAFFNTTWQDPASGRNLMTVQALTIGEMAEGWSLPWEYFWHSEGALGLGVLAVMLLAMWRSTGQAAPIPRRVWFWSALIAVSYLLLATFSVILGLFQVNGRIVKPLVPLFALGGGWALRRIATARPLAVAFAVILLGAGTYSFLGHARRVFPGEIRRQLAGQGVVPRFLTSFSDSLPWPEQSPTTRPDLVLVNAQTLFPTREYQGFPAGEVLFSRPHPLTYLPLQYEGATPGERDELRRRDYSIKLIRLAPAQ